MIVPLHVAIWNGDLDQVKQALLSGDSVETREQHGFRALHFALKCAHRNTKETVDLLLDVGHARVRSRDTNGWKAVHHAIQIGNEELLRRLVERAIQHTENQQLPALLHQKITSAARKLESIPDFEATLDVNLTSWVPMLSSLLPRDTIKIWKTKDKLRIDMSLSGFKSLRWKHGHFSTLLLGNQDKFVTLDHERQTIQDWLAVQQPNESQIQHMMHILLTNRVMTTCVAMEDASLRPRHHWLDPNGPQIKETIGIYENANIYDVDGINVQVQARPAKAPHHLLPQNEIPTSPGAWGMLDKLQDTMVHTVISAGLEHAIPVAMQSGDTIGWKFYLDDYDVEFSICFVEDEWYRNTKAENDPEKCSLISEVVRQAKVSPTKDKPLTGTFTAKGSGNLIVRWDNAHAMFRTKKLHYSVYPVLENNEQELSPVADSNNKIVTFEEWFGITLDELPPELSSMNPKPSICMHSEPPSTNYSKNMSGTLYMGDNFPLTVEQFIPIVEVLAKASSQLSSLKDVFLKNLPPGFPVKVAVPVFPSVTASVTFTKMELKSTCDSFFEIPSQYKLKPSKTVAVPSQAFLNLADKYVKSFG
ncbi:hypothetical protein THRCLA_00751 [Thraustotheca clavata]|uniref:GOLD domain-containing protein n=1 Tax=Thraustotheca clavata TaxID=74557 RepID=A0A1W0AAN3_9STRA|nr:hypothetical protein THRCLA_00751 [Thraustotheca clavata]